MKKDTAAAANISDMDWLQKSGGGSSSGSGSSSSSISCVRSSGSRSSRISSEPSSAVLNATNKVTPTEEERRSDLIVHLTSSSRSSMLQFEAAQRSGTTAAFNVFVWLWMDLARRWKRRHYYRREVAIILSLLVCAPVIFARELWFNLYLAAHYQVQENEKGGSSSRGGEGGWKGWGKGGRSSKARHSNLWGALWTLCGLALGYPLKPIGACIVLVWNAALFLLQDDLPPEVLLSDGKGGGGELGDMMVYSDLSDGEDDRCGAKKKKDREKKEPPTKKGDGKKGRGHGGKKRRKR
ncbi:hypothetical protein B0T17DRAFT_350143 [Bombardia bombarda]|uniref:Uncharacterized protein n=1 Tax=Bombardia bombarda TaxID=252184 RepID=A0AA39WHV1_9PEZI|nr:hypothetical protein B0T17DRAFT_350143 [Bombardia bombarda]